MAKLLILGNSEKPEVLEAVEAIEPWLRERAEITVKLDMNLAAGEVDADCAVVFGGDGTMLRAARALGTQQVPIIGINVGKFGFLSETTLEEAKEVLGDVMEGRYTVAERMMLGCELVRGGEVEMNTLGLNDAVVSRGALSRLITLEFYVDGELVTTYGADGLIVSTPVGSTAHSLAAGGPILYPDLNAFVVCPICPHTLSNRPLVLPDRCELEIRPRRCPESPSLTVDGQVAVTLQEGDRVVVRRAAESLQLIQTSRRTFFQTLRSKLDWRGRPRYVK